MSVKGFERIVNEYGEPVQQALTSVPADNIHANFNRLVLGIVLAVHPSDAEANRTAYQKQDRRGYLHTCTVQVIEGGKSEYFTLDNVIITPDARSGLDDYSEHLPRGCTGLVTGEAWNSDFSNINPYDLDGDWCIVGFLGGSLDSPFIVRWWPHPRNFDAATSGKTNPTDTTQPYLAQDGRYFTRVNGVEFVVSKAGDIYLSTHRTKADLTFGTPLTPSDGRFPSTIDAETGGSFKAWIKASQSFELDWNDPISGLGVLDIPDPSLPQSNPARVGTLTAKASTYAILDRGQVYMAAPESIELHSGQKLLLNSVEGTTLNIGTNAELTVGASASLSVVEDLDITVDGSIRETSTVSTTLRSEGPIRLTSAATSETGGNGDLNLTDTGARLTGDLLDLAAGQIVLTASNARNDPDADNDDSTITLHADASDSIIIGTGALGGVVGGIPLLDAFTVFQNTVDTAAAGLTNPDVQAYSTRIIAAVHTLVRQLEDAVSISTKVG